MLATAVEGVSPRFLSLLSQEDLASRRVLDVGCGAGRVALALAPAARWVVGLDRDADLIAEARARAERAGFSVEALEVERSVQRFNSVEEALAAAVGLQERWRADGRWLRYIEFLEAGGRTLTRSHLIVKARRP